MNRLNRICFIVALSGFLFGFDIIVISGVDQVLQDLWNSSDLFHGFVVMGTALWGTVIGAIFGGYPSNRYGRKKTLIIIGLLFLISAIGSAMVSDPISFAIFRFIGGLGIGASTIAAPAYLTEISPSKERGRIVAMYQLSIVIGILAAMASNYLIEGNGDESWRWMIGVEALPALFFCLLILKIPQSPRWLLSMGRVEEFQELKLKYSLEIDEKALLDKPLKSRKRGLKELFKRKNLRITYLVILIAFFNQFSGINAVLYYAPRIFELGGLERSAALLGGVGIGIVNLVFTLLGMWLIDRAGRKQLMYIGSVAYIVSLSIIAFYFFQGIQSASLSIFLFLFIAAHAIGQGTVIWVFMAEIFPTELRASGQALGSSVHWILAALIPSAIPYLFSMIGAATVFMIFGILMIVQLFWVYFYMPETKGKSLEEIVGELRPNE
ncbi:MAG: MFS transporter [Flavobacteriales bacterium]|nr:MFS transporter [Flavobacteriales bacterium]